MAVAWQMPILITTNPPGGRGLILPLHAVVVASQDRNIPSVFQLWLMGRLTVPGETKENLLHTVYMHLYVQV